MSFNKNFNKILNENEEENDNENLNTPTKANKLNETSNSGILNS